MTTINYGFFFMKNNYNHNLFLSFSDKNICFFFQQMNTFFNFLLEIYFLKK